MRHKRSKWICKNWVIVYISSFPCCCHREVLVDKMGIDESFSLVSSKGSCWVIMVSEKFGDMLDLICFVCFIYRSQPTSIFHPFLVGETVQLDQVFEIAVIKFPALQTRLWRFFPILWSNSAVCFFFTPTQLLFSLFCNFLLNWPFCDLMIWLKFAYKQ